MTAPVADVGAAAVLDFVQVSAQVTQFGSGKGQPLFPGRREDDLVNLVASALVVDDASRAEFGDREEARTREELVIGALEPAAGNVGREREPREVVAGEETLACEVAVAVEVRLEARSGVGTARGRAGRPPRRYVASPRSSP